MSSNQVLLQFGREPEQQPVAIEVPADEVSTEETVKEPAWKTRVRALMKSLDDSIDALADNSRLSPADLVARKGSPAWRIAEAAIGEFGQTPFTILLEDAARKGNLDELRGRVHDLLETLDGQVPVGRKKSA